MSAKAWSRSADQQAQSLNRRPEVPAPLARASKDDGHGSGRRPSRSIASPVLRDRIDQREPALLDLPERALERRADVLRVLDRPLAVAAHGARERAEVGLRPEQVHADMGLALARGAQLDRAQLRSPGCDVVR